MGKNKDWTDDSEGGSGGIHEEHECCEGDACCWHNTPAQSEEEE